MSPFQKHNTVENFPYGYQCTTFSIHVIFEPQSETQGWSFQAFISPLSLHSCDLCVSLYHSNVPISSILHSGFHLLWVIMDPYNDQHPVGRIPQLLEHCTQIPEVSVQILLMPSSDHYIVSQCSPWVLAQQVRDNSCPVFFKTTDIVFVNLQEVAGGKNRCLRW